MRGAMFFGFKTGRRSRRGASQPSDPVRDEAVEQQSRQWNAWRRSAQKVTRTWNEWLAADGRERDTSYTRHISALAEEERAAAEIELLLKLGGEAKDASVCTGPAADTDAARSEAGEAPSTA
jgi:hypothetical protein